MHVWKSFDTRKTHAKIVSPMFNSPNVKVLLGKPPDLTLPTQD